MSAQNEKDIYEFLKSHELIVWGTGVEAEYFIKKMQMYQDFWHEVAGEQLCNIRCFWDQDSRKQEKRFYGWEVLCPQPKELSENQICIFAFLGYQTYKTMFHDVKEGMNGIFHRKFLHYLRHMFLNHCESLFNRLVKRHTVHFSKLSRGSLMEEFSSRDFSSVTEACHAIRKSGLSDLAKSLMCDLLISMCLKYWVVSGYNKVMWEVFKQRFSLNELIASLEFFFGQEMEDVADFFFGYSWGDPKQEIRTIGIYNKTYRNGGGPKVLSLLMPIYIKMGYRVVFFTDELVPKDEYPLPKEVIRIVLKNKYGEYTEKRLLELDALTRQYHVDVMCYHHRIDEEDFFYDMVFLKSKGIYVLAMPHLMFMMLIAAENGMERKFHKMYKVSDAMVVLSKANQIFWNDLGCRAVYIPNPIEKGGELLRKPIDFSKKNGNSILWAGRIEQKVKNVLDVIDVMRHLRRVCPTAKLRVVGNIENRAVYEKLKQQILKYELEHTIELCDYSSNIETYYETADVFLMTSRMEAFPMVVAESKLYGVPMVLYELPYLELLKDGKGYISVPQRDSNAMAQAVAKLLADEDLRLKLSNDARESIVPFVHYDIAGAWQHVFRNMGRRVKERASVEENDRKIVYELLLSKIWEQQSLY